MLRTVLRKGFGTLSVFSFRPQCEILEGRDLLAGGISLAGGVLTIRGSAQADRATVTLQGDQISVQVTGGVRKQMSAAVASVRQIVFLGGEGNDRFINQTAIASRALGGAGNDFLHGGSGVDLLNGGGGDDTLVGDPDGDQLLGGPGKNRIRRSPNQTPVVQTILTSPTPNARIPAPIVPPPTPVADPFVLDASVATTMSRAAAFLHTGSNPRQIGLADGVLDPLRTAVVRGRVLDRSGAPLPDVTVSVLNRPEFGSTRSQADGSFDLAVNGGAPLTINYAKSGFLSSQRQVNVPWQNYALVNDVVLVPLDSRVTTLDLGAAIPIQVAQGNPVTEADGTRQNTLLISQGTQATMTLPDGSTQPLTTLNLRATEYTVGPNGVLAMPGELPPTSGYTYAVELSVDEALAVGATRVDFTQTLYNYVDNFLDFPVGMAVPVGWYDRTAGRWVPSENGRVIRILSETAGLADIDGDGDGDADTPAELAALGFTDAEREQLALLYEPNQEFWRVPLTHFTPWDCNWPYGPPPGARPPQVKPPKIEAPCDCQCSDEYDGSIISAQSQSLAEEVAIAGTPFTLRYDSLRVPGRLDSARMEIAVSNDDVPADVTRITLVVEVAGRRFEQSFAPLPNQTVDFAWDGKDAYGRTLQGLQPVTVTIGYVYDAVYYAPGTFENAFAGLSGIPLEGNPARQEVTLQQRWQGAIGYVDVRGLGLGGWTLDVHHVYDVVGRTLYQGDGTRRGAEGMLANHTQIIAGRPFGGPPTESGSGGSSDDGIPAVDASLTNPFDVVVAADGSYFIAEPQLLRIRKVDPNGIITTYAGGGFDQGDNIPALGADIGAPQRLAIGPDGSLYFFSLIEGAPVSVRRISPDGILSTVAGNGTFGFSGDGGPATQAQIAPSGLAVASDGTLYISEAANNRIRRVGTDGIITTLAGTGMEGFSGDGGPASSAQLTGPRSIALLPDGSLVFFDANDFDIRMRLRRIGTDGIITTIAGDGTRVGADADHHPAVEARFGDWSLINNWPALTTGPDGSIYLIDHTLVGGGLRQIAPDGLLYTIRSGRQISDETGGLYVPPDGLSRGPDGNLYMADQWDRILRVGTPMPGSSITDIFLPSSDGSEMYQFSGDGRHLRTLDALTGVTVYTFGYDAAKRLLSVTDRHDNVFRIERDAAGNPTALVAPFGQRTVLNLDANGYLSRLTDPAGGSVQITYDPSGLLETYTDARGVRSEMTYDELGRLTRNEKASTLITLVRSEVGEDQVVSVTTAEGRTTTYRMSESPGNVHQQIITGPNGLQTVQTTQPDGSETVTLPDGTVFEMRFGPDPRFGMLSPVIVSQTITTPGGVRSELMTTRTVTLSNPNNPLTVTQMVETTTVNGVASTTTYNGDARTMTYVSPEGRSEVLTLNALGQVVRSEVPGVPAQEFQYDSRGRVVRVTQGDRSSQFSYGPDGMLASYTDPQNQTVSYQRDPAGRVTAIRQPDGRDIVFTHDLDGNLTSLTPPGRSAYDFEYTDTGELQSTIPPDLGPGSEATTISYNQDRQPTLVSRPDGTSVGRTYDAAGRLRTIATAEGVATWTYHPTTGLLTGVSAPGGVNLAFGYDGGLRTSTTWSGPVAGSVTQVYNDDFRVVEQRVNGGHAITFQYDNDGLVTQVGALSLAHDPQIGRITGTTLNGITDAIGYAATGEPTTYHADFNGTTLLSFNDTRDAVGRITTRVEVVEGVSRTLEYRYDAVGQLIEVQRDGVIVATYEYDSNGNRLSYTNADGTVTGEYDAHDRLTQYGTTTYTYTLAGELQSKTDANGTTTYHYDALGNLRSVELPNGTDVEYLIDGSSRRIGKSVNGVLVQGLLYDGQLSPIAELDGAGMVVSRFVYANATNVPEYMVKEGNTYRLITDQVGSVRLVVNAATGVVAQRLNYDEFGRVLLDTNPGFQPFGFGGGLYDRDTGLVRFGARDYDAQTGRWTAKDPLGFAGAQSNLYAYVNNNPVNLVDPTGQDWFETLKKLTVFNPALQAASGLGREQLRKQVADAQNAKFRLQKLKGNELCKVALIDPKGNVVKGEKARDQLVKDIDQRIRDMNSRLDTMEKAMDLARKGATAADAGDPLFPYLWAERETRAVRETTANGARDVGNAAGNVFSGRVTGTSYWGGRGR